MDYSAEKCPNNLSQKLPDQFMNLPLNFSRFWTKPQGEAVVSGNRWRSQQQPCQDLNPGSSCGVSAQPTKIEAQQAAFGRVQPGRQTLQGGQRRPDAHQREQQCGRGAHTPSSPGRRGTPHSHSWFIPYTGKHRENEML